jgi:predicted nucleotidyltransferase
MTQSDILDKLEVLKPKLKDDGITIIGIFGSYARGDFSKDSDIDLLYEIDNPSKFVKVNGGFGAFTKLVEIKEFLSAEFGKSVDLVAKSSLNEIGEKYILRDLVDV